MRAGRSPGGTNLVVVGFRAAGVLEAARAAAARLGFAFLDTGGRVAAVVGLPPAEVVEHFGEARLRRLEARLVRELPDLRRTVIVPGTGMLDGREARQHLRRAGQVVYLRPAREDLVRRLLRRAAPAPGVGGLFDIAAEARALYDRTDPIFRAASDVVLDAGARPAEAVAARIVERLTGIDGGATP